MNESEAYEERRRLLKVGERVCATEMCLDQPEGVDIGAWREIKTAPKQGRSFLVHCNERANTYAVYRRESDRTFYHFGSGDKLDEVPTCWQPLPDPPKPAYCLSCQRQQRREVTQPAELHYRIGNGGRGYEDTASD